MFFLLTKFFYPIERKIPLTKHFGFYFDNPKTLKEINYIKDIIKQSWDLSEITTAYRYLRLPMKKEVENLGLVTHEKTIEEFCNSCFSKQKTKMIISELEGNPEKIIDFYAKNWVIVRFDNPQLKSEHARFSKSYREDRKRNIKSIIMLDDDHIFEIRERQLVNFSFLVSALIGDEEYFGWNFLLTESRNDILEGIHKIPIMYCIQEQMFGLLAKVGDPMAYQYNFKFLLQKINLFISQIDKRLRNRTIEEELLLYTGETLSTSKPHKNKFSSLVRLVGILEMLLTHQPDFNRFNVDESITKQFVLKTGIIAYIKRKNVSLEDTRKKLKEIYQQRSNIVHGNFKEVNKFKTKLKNEDRYFDDLICNCYDFIKMSLIMYLEDPSFIKFLKES